MSIELIVALSIAAGALVMGLFRAYQSVLDAQGRVAKLVKAKTTQIDRIRKAGRNSLNLKRSIRDAKRRRDGAELEVEEAASKLQTADEVDHRLFVFDDRKTKADFNWVATVSHASFAQSVSPNALPDTIASWAKGRRFLVFALDDQKARDKIASRYPERLGFRIAAVEAQPDPKVVVAKAATPAAP